MVSNPKYVHIMLIGERPEHIDTALKDPKFHPISRIYLIHSPNSKTGRKVQFEVIAKEQKKKIESNEYLDVKVQLVPLTDKGAFGQQETIDKITEITNYELKKKRLISEFYLALNISGGTNMMAASAILGASLNRIENAYYVLDTSYDENKDKPSKLEKIDAPFSIQPNTTKQDEDKILKVIANENWTWDLDGETEVIERKYDRAAYDAEKQRQKMERMADPTGMTEFPPINLPPALKIDKDWDDDWTDMRTVEQAILQTDLKKKLPEMKGKTIDNKLEDMETEALITVMHQIPSLTNAKKTGTPTRTFRMKKQNLIQITAQGRARIRPKKFNFTI